MANAQIKITVGKLRTAQYNPRKWSQEATEKLTESIERFGFVDPVIVNSAPGRKHIVIGGHFRLHIAKQLGITEVPVVYVNIPEEEREKELNLRLNRNTGEWDLELLKEFDIPLLLDSGFDDLDLGNIWDNALSVDDDHFDVDRQLQEVIQPTTQYGDVFRMGKHLLLCATPSDVDIGRLKSEPPASLLLIDPPAKVKLGTVEDAIERILPVMNGDAHFFGYCKTKDIATLQSLYQKAGIAVQDAFGFARNAP